MDNKKQSSRASTSVRISAEQKTSTSKANNNSTSTSSRASSSKSSTSSDPPKPAKDYIDADKIKPIEAVYSKYSTKGWDTLDVSDKKSINDIIAKRGDKFHFVQVVLDDSEAKYTGESRNMFIQNAMSNNAIPVWASVKKVGVRTAEGGKMTTYKITFKDTNNNSRILI